MKIFSWMQNKLNGRLVFGTKKEDNVSSPRNIPNFKQQQDQKEELADWPRDGLLAIGTIGNHHHNCLEKVYPLSQDQAQYYSEDNFDNTPDDDDNDDGDQEEDQGEADLHHQNESNSLSSDHDSSTIVKHVSFRRSTSLLLSRGNYKEISLDNINNNKSIIGKTKSFSFLLKKMFACSNGFSPPVSSLKDTPVLPESRMEKILRAILHKKIYPQSCSNTATATTSSTKRYLENNHVLSYGDVNDDIDEENDDEIAEDIESKWVKTDSEYIVLEL